MDSQLLDKCDNTINDQLEILKSRLSQDLLDNDSKIKALNEVLEKLINLCLSENQDELKLINDFKVYLKFSDIKFFSIKLVLKLIQNKTKVNDHYLNNACNFLFTFDFQDINTDKGKKKLELMENFVLNDSFKFQYTTALKHYSKAWITFLKFKINLNCYKKVLSLMDTKIIPFLRNPLDIADFLIYSYNIGGSFSLLSLSSLFVLMTKYNLEYPDFYSNFYALVTPDILHVKYRFKFIYWADIFLSSTNLPSYIVAAFVKKLSRLALISSVETLYSLLPLIENLLIRHPNLIEMFNKSNPYDYKTDPFDFDENDLNLTKAIESSLWEIKFLKNHWNWKVKELTKFIDSTLEKDEKKIIETNFNNLIEEAFLNETSDLDIELNHELGKTAFEFFQ